MLRRFPAASAALFAAALLAVLPADVHAGTWFDLGLARHDTLRAEQDPRTLEVFPPSAFGVFPRGSWVWQEINLAPCSELRWPGQVCGTFVRGFRIEFNDGGCGCGGYVERSSTLRLAWDPAALAERGIPASRLRLVFNYNPPVSIYNIPGSRAWGPVEGAVPDVVNHWFEIPVAGDILGIREYAIVTDDFVPTLAVTWSRIKSLYDR